MHMNTDLVNVLLAKREEQHSHNSPLLCINISYTCETHITVFAFCQIF